MQEQNCHLQLRARGRRDKEHTEARISPAANRSTRIRNAQEGREASAQKLEASSITETLPPSQQAGAVTQDIIEVLPPSGHCLSSPPVTHIWERSVDGWGVRLYIRIDLQGSFHTYPDVGGPFQSLEEAYKAIDLYLEDYRDPKMRMDQEGLPPMEMAIRQCLYWPDGTIKKRTKSCVTKAAHKRMCQLVQALVDKYNDDHKLIGDMARKLKDVLLYQSIREERVWYYHLNFTTRIKEIDDVDTGKDNLFFVEVKRSKCYGCTNRGTVGMKHPDISEYLAGHLDVMFFTGDGKWIDSEEDDKYVKAKEAKIRRMYKGLDDPLMEKLLTLPPGVTIVNDSRGARVEDWWSCE
uniref:DUF3615 domain-containing protein n=1 Tax=Leersia perrieri TaxID=77586 RepID=A0A0D9X9A3_9ORYZ